MGVLTKWSMALGAAMTLGLSGCGGGGGDGDGVEAGPSPAPSAPVAPARLTTEGIWGEWVDDKPRALFMVSPTGDTYGALVTDHSGTLRYEVIRGSMPGLQGQIPISAFVGVGVHDTDTRSVVVTGTFEPMWQMNLQLLPENRSMVAQYDGTYDIHTPIADQAATYEAILVSGGYRDSFEFQVSPTGVLALRSLTPGFEHCQATGTLSVLSGATALMAIDLRFAGDQCLIDADTRITGYAQYDTQSRGISVFGMNEAATVGLIADVNR